MKRFWYVLLLLLGSFAPCLAAAAPPAGVPAVVALRDRIDPKRFPDADVILLSDREEVAYTVEATDSGSDDCCYWILTEKGRDGLRTLSFHFNTFYEKLSVPLVEIVRPDGRVVKPELQRKVVTEPGQISSSIYDPANKILQIGIPGLEVGDLLRIVVQRETVRPRMRGVWCGIAVLQADCPVISYRYEVVAPEALPLAAISVKDEAPGTLQSTVRHEGESIHYVWQAEMVPQLHPEPDMPPLYLNSMRVLVSTAPDWPTVSRWYDALCRRHIEAVSPELVRTSCELAAGAKSEMAKIRAIFRFVAGEVRYTGITREDEAPGYEPHDAALTFQQRHGVCRDKAALLVAMLRAAGLEAYPVLFMAGHPKDREVPNNYFNHAVVAVKSASGEYILMDPTDENTAELLPAYAMNRSYLVATPAGDTLRRTPDVPVEKNLLVIRSEAELDRDNRLQVRSVLKFGGINDNFYRGAFARWPRENIRQFLAQALKKAVPGAELTAWRNRPADFRDLSKPLELELEFSVGDYADTGWGDGVLTPPFLGGAFGAIHFLLGNTGLEKRLFALETESTAGIHEEFVLKLPAVLTVAALPEPMRIEEGPLLFSRSLVSEGKNLLRGRRTLELVTSSIAPDRYPALKQSLRRIEAAERRKAVIRNDFAGDFAARFPHARSVVEESSVRVEVESADRFTTRVSERRTVLNYGGVKAFAELRIPYYPAWQEVRFLGGEVTAPDGTVQTVDPNSVVVMDRDDGAAAPRYPAGKVMVVSFPGVRPGSRIASRWETVCCDGNVLAGIYRMDGSDPVLKRSVEVSLPEALAEKVTILPPGPGFAVSKRRENGRVTFAASGSDLVGSAPEPGTPPVWCFAPCFGASAFQYAGFAEELRARTERLSSDQPEAAALAEALVKDAQTPLEKMRILRDFVAESVREAGPELNDLPLSALSAADVTLKERYGSSADRAILLLAMLKAVKIPAGIVAVGGLPALPEVMRSLERTPLHVFTGLLVRAEVEDGVEFYLNDTGRYDIPGAVGHDGAAALNCATGELIAIEAGAEFRDSVVRDCGIVCAKDGSAEITLRTDYYGTLYGAMRKKFAQLTPELKKRFYQEAAAALVEGARILECAEDFSGYPGTVTLKLRVADFTARSGDFLMLTLPSCGADSLLRTAGKRKLPCLLTDPIDREYRYAVQLPENVERYELAGEAQQWNAPGTDGMIAAERTLRGSRIELVRKVRLPAMYLTAAEYPALETAQRMLSSDAARSILVKVTGK